MLITGPGQRIRLYRTLAAKCAHEASGSLVKRRGVMGWKTPTLIEICIGLEINGYLPAEL
jgi:coenzyme PQQ precursor peptide PqqA